MKRYRTSLCCRSGMSYRTARTLSRIAKLGEKAVARSNCSQNRNILFKCPRWSKLVGALNEHLDVLRCAHSAGGNEAIRTR